MGNKVLAALESDGPELFTLLVRLTLRADLAEDLLQDLFVKLSGGNSIKGVHDPRAYIRRMAINLAFDWRRSRDLRERRMNSHQTSRDEEIPAWLKISQHEQAERILSVAAELSELQRQAFALRFVHDESFEQIGRTLGRTAHQARGLCHAAVVEIRKRMAQTEHNFANG